MSPSTKMCKNAVLLENPGKSSIWWTTHLVKTFKLVDYAPYKNKNAWIEVSSIRCQAYKYRLESALSFHMSYVVLRISDRQNIKIPHGVWLQCSFRCNICKLIDTSLSYTGKY